jgi:acyl carrier protein
MLEIFMKISRQFQIWLKSDKISDTLRENLVTIGKIVSAVKAFLTAMCSATMQHENIVVFS